MAGWERVAAALVVAAGAAACSATPVTGDHPAWNALPADALGAGLTRIVATASGPAGVIGVGSVTTNGNRVPALWRTSDGVTWQPLSTEPKSPYGFESELTTVAVEPDGRSAAIGQAVGGTHGNPRVGSWYLDGTTLREVVAPVELYGGPRQGSVGPMSAGPSGFVVVGTRTDHGNDRTGAAVWTSPDAHTEFTLVDTDPALLSAPGETVRGLGGAGGPHGYVAVGDRAVDGRIDDDGMIWTSANGQTWTRVSPDAAVLGGPGDQVPQVATAWGDGWAVAGVETIGGRTGIVVWVTRNGTRWFRTRVDDVGTSTDPLSAVTSVAASGGRLVVGARLGDRFVAASSTDGVTWAGIPLPADAVPDPHGVLVLTPLGTSALSVAATTDAGTRLWRTTLRA